MTGSLASSLALMLGMGFMGSLHCIGMCGGLIGALGMSRERVWWPGLTAYQFGRVTTYSLLGLLVGLAGMGLAAIGGDTVQRILASLAALLMIAFALNLAGALPDPLKRFGAMMSRKTGLAKLAVKVSGSTRPGSWYALGMINGLLPCGLVYAALSMALATGHALQGTLMMAAFGLGTIPAMMAVPSIMRGMTPAGRVVSLRIAALLIVVMGLFTLYRAVLSPPSMHGMHHTATSQSTTEQTYGDAGAPDDLGLEKVSIGSTPSPSAALRPTLS